MNGRPWWPWVVFGAGVAVVVAALAYVSVEALGLERREEGARRAAAVEESARAALWRMDSAMAPIIARESSRPYFHYQSFYPAHRAYTSMWEEVRPGEVLVASPLLVAEDPLVRLHFQWGEAAGLTSPQAPTGNTRDLVEAAYVASASVAESARRLEELRRALGEGAGVFAGVPGVNAAGVAPALTVTPSPPRERGAAAPEVQAEADYAARSMMNQIARSQTQQIIRSEEQAQTPVDWEGARRRESPGAVGVRDEADAGPAAEVVHGDMVPVWIQREGGGGEVLVLARRVRGGGGGNGAGDELVQGVWLDWGALRAWLLEQASDVAAGAELTPVLEEGVGAGGGPPGRRLASIPAVLVMPAAMGDGGGGSAGGWGGGGAWSPMRVTLAMSWMAVLAAAAAAGVVLRGAVELAERRGRFVSAVTHELRTPLTTFCLYTQMLDDGVVRDEGARREYLGTLRRESRRLARIVENVLEFARLGRARGPGGEGSVGVAEVMERVGLVLEARAKEGGLELSVDVAPDVGGARVAADEHTIEQVLLNLVENACKYAAGGGRVEVLVRRGEGGRGEGGRVEMMVRDYGPGIERAEVRRLFRPFQRGTSLAHASTPGLGLGLAVSRGLARRVGGDVVLARTSAEGSAFMLVLPAADGG